MSLSGRLRRAAWSFARQALGKVYEKSLSWVTVEDLVDIEIEYLGEGARLEIPETKNPLLIHYRDDASDYLELPRPRATIIERPLFHSGNNTVFLNRHTVLADTVNDKYPFRVGVGSMYGRPVQHIGGYATSFRAHWNNYYHLLIDVLPRLDLLRHRYFERFEEISLLCPGGLRPLEGVLLEKFGFPPRTRLLLVEEDALLRPDRYVHVSYPTLRYCGAIPPWYRDRIRQTLLPDRASRRSNRILISRRRASKRRLLNSDELERALIPLGFETVELEKLSFESQVELFYDAEAVVGTHGAGLTNLLFADNARVVEIFPSWYVIPHYLYLCQSLNHPYRYCVSKRLPPGFSLATARKETFDNLMEYNDTDFSVNVDDVLQRLHELGLA